MPKNKGNAYLYNMDLVSKYELIEKIVQSNNEVLLQQVKHLLEEEEAESWENLDPALKSSIARGINQSNKEQVTPHARVMKSIKAKYRK